jgi:hypothetical protein
MSYILFLEPARYLSDCSVGTGRCSAASDVAWSIRIAAACLPPNSLGSCPAERSLHRSLHYHIGQRFSRHRATCGELLLGLLRSSTLLLLLLLS